MTSTRRCCDKVQLAPQRTWKSKAKQVGVRSTESIKLWLWMQESRRPSPLGAWNVHKGLMWHKEANLTSRFSSKPRLITASKSSARPPPSSRSTGPAQRKCALNPPPQNRPPSGPTARRHRSPLWRLRPPRGHTASHTVNVSAGLFYFTFLFFFSGMECNVRAGDRVGGLGA